MATNMEINLPAGALANPFSVLQDESDVIMPIGKSNQSNPKAANAVQMNASANSNSEGISTTMHAGGNVCNWDDLVEKALNDEKNTRNARFFLLKMVNGSFEKVSPFLIHKTLESMVGEVKNIKKIRSGDLLVEVKNESQSAKIMKMKEMGNKPITVAIHKSLNTSRGVISENELLDVSEAEILENLREENVIAVRRIIIQRDGKEIKTKHIILTFGHPTIPDHIRAGYLRCTVRPFIPNPLRCFKCQRFGHSKSNCRGKQTCARCSEQGHDADDCSAAFCCINCRKDHPAYSRSCEKWILEKEVQAIRTKQNLPYNEARKLVESRSPKSGVSYVAAASTNKSVRSIGIQTLDYAPKSFGPLVNGIRQPIKEKVISAASSQTSTSERKMETPPSQSPPATSSTSTSPKKISPLQPSSSEILSTHETRSITPVSSTKSSNKSKLYTPKNLVETRLAQKCNLAVNIKSHSQVSTVKKSNASNKKSQFDKNKFPKASVGSNEEPILSLHVSDEEEVMT